MFYLFIRWLCSIGARFFFKELEVIGAENIPRDAGYILAVNHQNSFIDAILCGITNRLSLHYLTRSDVFVAPWDKLLNAIHMMPVYRMRDGISKLSKNEETFERCYDIIRNKGGVLIFSEANTAKEHYLRPLSKGTARLAIQAQLAVDQPMYLVPTGLNYVDHDQSGHKVVVNYGKPISISEYIESYHSQPPQTLNRLRKDLTTAIKSLMWIPENDDSYQSKSAIVQHFGDHCNNKELRALLADHERINLPESVRSNHWLRGLLSIPNWPVFYLIKLILQELRDPQFILSIKFLASILLLPLYWIVVYIFLFPFVGFWIANVIIGSIALSLLVRAQIK